MPLTTLEPYRVLSLRRAVANKTVEVEEGLLPASDAVRAFLVGGFSSCSMVLCFLPHSEQVPVLLH